MPRATQTLDDPELRLYFRKVGKAMKARRETMGLSQEESARMAGIPVGSLRDIEQGYDTRVSYHCLNAKHLEVAFGYGVSGDVTRELKALGERVDRLCECVDKLAATLSDRPRWRRR